MRTRRQALGQRIRAVLFRRKHTPQALFARFIHADDDQPELRSLGMDVPLGDVARITQTAKQVQMGGPGGKGATALTIDPSGVILSWPAGGDDWFLHGALMNKDIQMAFAHRVGTHHADVTMVDENLTEIAHFIAQIDDPGAFSPSRPAMGDAADLIGVRVSAVALDALIDPITTDPAQSGTPESPDTPRLWTLESLGTSRGGAARPSYRPAEARITCRCRRADPRTNELTGQQFWAIEADGVIPLLLALPSDISPMPTAGDMISGRFIMTVSTMGLLDAFDAGLATKPGDEQQEEPEEPAEQEPRGTTERPVRYLSDLHPKLPPESTPPRALGPRRCPQALSPDYWSDAQPNQKTLEALDLPAGHQVFSNAFRFTGWVSDEPLDAGERWWKLVRLFPQTGLWPICSKTATLRDPRVATLPIDWAHDDPRIVTDPYAWFRERNPESAEPESLEELDVRDDVGWEWQTETAPLLIDVPPSSTRLEKPQGPYHLNLVACQRPSDAAAVLLDPWEEPGDLSIGLIAGCLRQWEERYGLAPSVLGNNHAVFALSRIPLAFQGGIGPDPAREAAQELAALASILWPYDWKILTSTGGATGPYSFDPPLDTLVSNKTWELQWE